MNLFQFAVAAVVDANSGYALTKSNKRFQADAESSPARSTSRRGMVTRLVNYLQRLRSGITAARIVYRKQRALKRSLRSLHKLDERMLEDIGLSRSDIIAAESGRIDQAALELRRIANRDTRRTHQNTKAVAYQPSELRKAANDAVFARAKCA